MNREQEKKIAQICLHFQIATEEQIRYCLSLQRKALEQGKYISLGETLLKCKYITSKQLRTIEEKLGISTQDTIALPSDITETSEKQGTTVPNTHPFPGLTTESQPKDDSFWQLAKGQTSRNTLSQSFIKDFVDSPHDSTREFTSLTSSTSSIMGKSQEFIWKEGEIFHHYRIEKELGRGGMGIVYLAFDQKLDRKVALKLLSSQELESKQVERFLLEAKSVAQLNHPHIIQVFDVGSTPQPYFTMEYIEGSTLDKYTHQKKLSFTEIAHIFEKVSQAIHLVHEKGIIHRDLKPENIMITQDQEPKVMDFGIAKVIDASLSQTGDLLGTPAYMSPEQADGKKVDSRSDVYSVGATIYEVLTSRQVFQGESIYNIIYQIMSEDPIRPGRLNPDIPIDLEAICLKCLEKDPRKRYSSAKELARDLNNFRKHKPLLAKPPSFSSSFYKWIRRNQTVTFLSLIFLSIIIASITWFIHDLREENKKTEKALLETDKARKKAESSQKETADTLKKLYESTRKERESSKLASKAQKELQDGFYPFIIKLTNDYQKQNNILMVDKILHSEYCPPKLRNWEWNWVQKTSHNEVLSLRDEKDPIRAGIEVLFFDQGKKIISASFDGKIRFWDWKKQKLIHRFPGKSGIEGISLSPDEENLVSIHYDKGVRVWNVKNKTLLKEWSMPYHLKACAFSHDGKKIAIVGHWDITIWSFPQAQKIATLPFGSGYFHSCTFSKDDKILLTACTDWNIQMWDWQEKKIVRTLQGHQEQVYQAVYSHDGTRIASVSKDSTIKIWDSHKGVLVKTLEGYTVSQNNRLIFQPSHRGDIFSCVFTQDGKKLITGGVDNTIRVWDINSARILKILRGHKENVNYLALHPNQKNIASVSNDTFINIWNIEGKDNPFLIGKHNGAALFCAFSPDGERVASCGDDLTIKIWNRSSGKLEKTLVGHFKSARGLAFSKDGKELISTGDDGSLRVWDLLKGQQKKVVFHPGDRFLQCRYFAQDTQVVVGGYTNTIFFYDRKTLKKVDSLSLGKNILKFELSPSGRLLVTGENSGKCKIWDLQSKKIIHTFKHIAPVSYCCFDHEEKAILTACHDNRIRIWNLKKKALVHTLEGHNGNVHSLRLSPDGKRIFSCGDDYEIKIWDYQTGRHLLDLEGHHNRVLSCDFNPNGQEVISTSEDGQVLLWSIDQIDQMD